MKRTDLMEQLAQKWTDEADIDTLMNFFFDYQYQFLEDLDDNELLDHADNSGFDVDTIED